MRSPEWWEGDSENEVSLPAGGDLEIEAAADEGRLVLLARADGEGIPRLGEIADGRARFDGLDPGEYRVYLEPSRDREK